MDRNLFSKFAESNPFTMNYPLISEYIEVIKSAGDNLEELTNLRPVLNDDGQPVMTSGGQMVKVEKIGFDDKHNKHVWKILSVYWQMTSNAD